MTAPDDPLVLRAPLRLPTWQEAYALLPGGPPSPVLGPPPGAWVEWPEAPSGWPTLAAPGPIPEGTAYFFTADQLAAEEVVKALLLDEFIPRYARVAGWALRRLFTALSLIPLAWTAPAPATVPTLERYMTTPTTPPRNYPANGVQLTLRFSQAGQDAVCVLGGLRDGTADPSSAMARAWCDFAWAAFRPLTHVSTTCVGATLRDVSKASGPVFDVGAPPNNSGQEASTQHFAPAATLIKWTTAVGGRRGKGRTFIPGVGAQVVVNGRTYSAAHSTAAATAIAAYLGTRPAGVPQPAVLSFTYGLASPITGGGLSPVVGLQDRRMRA